MHTNPPSPAVALTLPTSRTPQYRHDSCHRTTRGVRHSAYRTSISGNPTSTVPRSRRICQSAQGGHMGRLAARPRLRRRLLVPSTRLPRPRHCSIRWQMLSRLPTWLVVTRRPIYAPRAGSPPTRNILRQVAHPYHQPTLPRQTELGPRRISASVTHFQPTRSRTHHNHTQDQKHRRRRQSLYPLRTAATTMATGRISGTGRGPRPIAVPTVSVSKTAPGRRHDVAAWRIF